MSLERSATCVMGDGLLKADLPIFQLAHDLFQLADGLFKTKFVEWYVSHEIIYVKYQGNLLYIAAKHNYKVIQAQYDIFWESL